jgi:hypothetical protein
MDPESKPDSPNAGKEEVLPAILQRLAEAVARVLVQQTTPEAGRPCHSRDDEQCGE